MPYLKAARHRVCGERRCGRCNQCEARDALTSEDWYAVTFYGRVADQYVNQAPMGTTDGKAWLTTRLEGYEAALRIWDYPPADWTWLVESAAMLHRLVQGVEKVSAKELRSVTLESVSDG